MQPEQIGGRYRTLSAIGQGGMGTVWLCHDDVLNREVAVKQVGMLPGESVTDSARALREARSSAALSHRNVVTVFDFVEEAGCIWLIMEHVPGRSLSEIIKSDGPIDPAVVAEIGAQVADGLAAAHAAGTMHRDVKPGNVLIREDGVAKISDFGIARTHGDPALTQSGLLSGTPSYFSPELARGGEPGPATDVWALGATLYAAVEGHAPYQQQSNPVAVLHEIVSGPPRAPRRAAFLEPAILRMMDRDPASRWSMADAQHALRRLADAYRPEATLQSTAPTPVLAHSTQATQATQATPPAHTPPPAQAAARSGGTPAAGSAPAPRAAAATGAAKVSSTRGRRPASRRARPGNLAVLAVVLVLALAGVTYLVTRQGTNAQAGSGSGGSGSGGTDSGGTGSTSQKKDTSGGDTSGSSSAADKESFVRAYYAAAPGGTDKAWEMLGPGEQKQGRASYDRFWSGITSVEVQSARASEGSDTVEVTLAYRTKDGKVSTERKREGLISSDGGYLLESDVPAP